MSTSEDSDTEDLLKETRNYLAASESLAQGVIQMKRCTDANKEQVSRVSFANSALLSLSLSVRVLKTSFLLKLPMRWLHKPFVGYSSVCFQLISCSLISGKTEICPVSQDFAGDADGWDGSNASSVSGENVRHWGVVMFIRSVEAQLFRVCRVASHFLVFYEERTLYPKAKILTEVSAI